MVRSKDKRKSASKRGYGSTWVKLRKIKLSSNPYCERCNLIELIVPAVLVHHLDHNQFNNDLDNLQSLCNDCHEQEHKRNGEKDISGVDKDGLPTSPAHPWNIE